jgi:hypothetical protein
VERRKDKGKLEAGTGEIQTAAEEIPVVSRLKGDA